MTNVQLFDVPTPNISKQARSHINVVLFSGGSGTHSITEALRKHPQIALRILINAYDDGLSTGRLRRFLPGMLGPSDVRKNINRLMPVTERCHRSLKLLSDYRLAVGISSGDAIGLLEQMLGEPGKSKRLPEKLTAAIAQLSLQQAAMVRNYLLAFLEYFEMRKREGIDFDFTDCALGNLLFAGCYLDAGQDFNRSVGRFSEFHEISPDILLNITLGEDLYLVAEKEDGTVLRNEADIVAAQSTTPISNLFLLDNAVYRGRVETGEEPAEGWGALLRRAHRTPKMNPRAAQAIAEADVIIYGPGTQHSSLFPSYMSEGVAEAIAGNRGADKIFIGNIHRDHDIQTDDANDLARKFMEAMSRKGAAPLQWSDCVTQFFVQRGGENESGAAQYVPFDESRFAYPLETVRAKDWEAQEGCHYGGYVLDEVQQIVQARIDVELERIHHMVSILVPVLNEERTIEEVLKSLVALDFQPFDLTKEILVIDGGSTDHTVAIAQSVRTVKLLQLPLPLGRGAALKLGIEKARGNLVVFFPGDREYQPEDLRLLVASLSRSRFRAVIGSRAVKCTNLSEDLKKIYENKWGLYLASKYGGMLLSILTLLLYNRYVTDILSSVKGFDAQLLRSLAVEANGREFDAELVAKLARKREYLLEIPVDYAPRTRAAGKKITFVDGLRSIWTLVRHAFTKS